MITLPAYGNFASPERPFNIPTLNLNVFRRNGYWWYQAANDESEWNFWRCVHFPSKEMRIRIEARNHLLQSGIAHMTIVT